MGRILDTEEKLSRSEMEPLQLERLKWQVHYAYDHVPFYKEKWDALGLRPEMIQSLSDLSLLPFTEKNDLRDNYPTKLFAVPQKKILRFHASSGTTGKPIVVGYTKQDLHNWTRCCARMAVAAGVTEEDIAQVAFGYGLFTGGFGLHAGLEAIGASIIPMSSGNSNRQIMFMEDLRTTVLIATPSYVLHLIEIMNDMGVSPQSLALKIGMFGGEGHTPEMRGKIESSLGILDTQNYGLTELCGPGLSFECEIQDGMHINEDYFLAEIIDPVSGEILPEGSVGELVVTTLTKEGIPMIRYRTKDITRLIYEPCACGRSSCRMELISGRCDDMMVIRGVNVFPSQIESVLMTINGIGDHYQLIVTTEKFIDRLEVQVELKDGAMLQSYSNLESLTRIIRQKIREVLQIDVKVTLLNPKTLERSMGKAQRVVDCRGKSF